MTDDAVAKLIAGTKKGVGNQAPRYYVGAIETELLRARASEKEKDATIKALADALVGTALATDDDGPCWCGPVEKENGRHWDAGCVARRDALRLAGR